MSRLSFVIANTSQNTDVSLESSDIVEIVATVNGIDALLAAIRNRSPDAVLVSLFDDAQAVLAALEKITAPRPLILCIGPNDSQLILQSMRLGACDYIAPGPEEKLQLLASVARLAKAHTGLRRTPKSPLVAVTGSKGGVGASFVSCQLGASLAHFASRPVLVDGQFRHGDIALYLDVAPDYTFASLATRETIDPTFLHTTLARHESGLHLLATPQHPEDADTITIDCVEGVLSLLRREFEWVIWDTPQDFDERSNFIFDHADLILLVTTPDVPAMNHARMQLDLLQQLGHGEEKIRVVANRIERSASVSEEATKRFLGRSIDAGIPNDYARASACVNEGRTVHEIAPRSRLAKSISELARESHKWCDHPLPEKFQTRERVSWLPWKR